MLKTAREHMRLNQRQMADLMGIPDLANYNRIERGRREPTRQQLQVVKLLLFVYNQDLLDELMLSVTTDIYFIKTRRK